MLKRSGLFLLFAALLVCGLRWGGIGSGVLVAVFVLLAAAAILARAWYPLPGGTRVWTGFWMAGLALAALGAFPLLGRLSGAGAGAASLRGAMPAGQELAAMDFIAGASDPAKVVAAQHAAPPGGSHGLWLEPRFAVRALVHGLLFLAVLWIALAYLPRARQKSGETALALLALLFYALVVLGKVTENGTVVLWGPYSGNHRAQLLFLLVPFILSPILGRYRRRLRLQEKAGLLSLTVLALGLTGALAAAEGSRGTFVALCISALILLCGLPASLGAAAHDHDDPIPGRVWRRTLLLPVVAAVCGLAAAPWVIRNLPQEKVPVWAYDLALMARFPATGVGLGQFPLRVPEVESQLHRVTFLHGESNTLAWCAETGIPGAVLLLAGLVCAGRMLAVLVARLPGRKLRRAWPFLAFAPGVVLSASMEFGLGIPINLAILALFIARLHMLLWVPVHGGRDLPQGAQHPSHACFWMAGPALLGLVLLFWVRPMHPSLETVTPCLRAQVLTAPEGRSEFLARRHRLWGLRQAFSGARWAEAMDAWAAGDGEAAASAVAAAADWNAQPAGFVAWANSVLSGPLFAPERQVAVNAASDRNLLVRSGGSPVRTATANVWFVRRSENCDGSGAPCTFVHSYVADIRPPISRLPPWDSVAFPRYDILPSGTRIQVRGRMTGTGSGMPHVAVAFASMDRPDALDLVPFFVEGDAGDFATRPLVMGSGASRQPLLLDSIVVDLLPAGGQVTLEELRLVMEPPVAREP